MTILALETSCDETAVCTAEGTGIENDPGFFVLGNALLSQIELHKQYGGVFPSLAKREHAKNLIPLLEKILEEAGLAQKADFALPETATKELRTILEREPELLEQFLAFIPSIKKPPIDAIAVTYGPGLPPSLWVGINFAKALSLVWDVPLIPIDHMEGHLLSALLKKERGSEFSISNFQFPGIALLVSGGHTQLVLMRDWFSYEVIGETRDDAVGEAFDKVARMMGLPYPGGPRISALAERARTNAGKTQTDAEKITFPRPMLHSDSYDFSFSGLKTAVLYFLKKETGDDAPLSGEGPRSFKVSAPLQEEIAREFEDAAIDVLLAKTKKALEEYTAQTLLLGGGVSASKELRERVSDLMQNEFGSATLLLPDPSLTGDNALMIALAAYLRLARGERGSVNPPLVADGNLRLS